MAKDILKAKHLLNVRGQLLDLSVPKIMGVMNITPDSFFEGSRMTEEKIWLQRAEQMILEGVDILDVGGYSSRPGSLHIDEREEQSRVVKAIESIRKRFDTYISIDTFRSGVARAALHAGADIVNDISAGELDEKMFSLIQKEKIPYIMMHMKGTPQTMREMTSYDHLFFEILDYFQKKIKYLNESGVADVVVDMGFGFAKTIDQNYEILRNLDYFKVLECPILVGVSRKSMIFKTLNVDPSDALNGTTVLNTIALQKGAGILRVHDVKAAKETITLVGRTFDDYRN